MATCTFFGYRQCPEGIKPRLREILVDLIDNHAVDRFYVGNQGAFDRIVRSVLQELAQEYPDIRYDVVLAYLPGKRYPYNDQDYLETMLPEGIESVHPRYAIIWRNKWMPRQSDYVVTYVTYSWGGAAKFEQMARRQGKVVIGVGEEVQVHSHEDDNLP